MCNHLYRNSAGKVFTPGTSSKSLKINSVSYSELKNLRCPHLDKRTAKLDYIEFQHQHKSNERNTYIDILVVDGESQIDRLQRNIGRVIEYDCQRVGQPLRAAFAARADNGDIIGSELVVEGSDPWYILLS